MALIEPLDLLNIFVVNFAGTVEIFVFLMILLIAGLSAKFRLPNGVALPMFVIFIVFMAGTTLQGQFTGLFILSVILSSFFVYWAVSRYFN